MFRTNDGPGIYGNIMYDRRIVRGNTYAQHVLPAVSHYSAYLFVSLFLSFRLKLWTSLRKKNIKPFLGLKIFLLHNRNLLVEIVIWDKWYEESCFVIFLFINPDQRGPHEYALHWLIDDRIDNFIIPSPVYTPKSYLTLISIILNTNTSLIMGNKRLAGIISKYN